MSETHENQTEPSPLKGCAEFMVEMMSNFSKNMPQMMEQCATIFGKDVKELASMCQPQEGDCCNFSGE